MMKIQERYTWEAERPDGTILTTGGDLAGCVRFSLIPAAGTGLPQHDIVGVRLERRFCRGFHQTVFNQTERLPGRIYWRDGEVEQPTSDDLTAVLVPGDIVGKGVAGESWYPVAEVRPGAIVLMMPYQGISKPNGLPGKRIVSPHSRRFRYVHCIVCEAHSMWVDYETGAVLVALKDKDLLI